MLSAAAQLVIAQEATAGVMIAATLLLARALAPVESAIAGWQGLMESRDAYCRLDGLLRAHAPRGPSVTLPAPQGQLTLDGVAFVRAAANAPVLKGIHAHLEPGDALGIIGPSASGKSTLARIVTGMWGTSAGTVRLDGVDVAKWPRDQLGPHIGYLPQDVELFAGTVAQNIGRLRDVDDQAIVRAAMRAQTHEMILRLPQGYDTVIGAGGTGLSGGQRQRVALARALFGEPRLVVLDEPNANLDSDGERALCRALRVLHKAGTTVIVVTHRTSVLAELDKLLFLQGDGTQVFGPRDQVLRKLRRVPEVQLNIVSGGER